MSDMVSVPAEKIAALREALGRWDEPLSRDVAAIWGRGYQALEAARAVVDAVETDCECGKSDCTVHAEGRCSCRGTPAPSPARDDAEKAWHHWAIEVAPLNRSPHDAFIAGYAAAHMAAPDELTALREWVTELESVRKWNLDNGRGEGDIGLGWIVRQVRAILGDA